MTTQTELNQYIGQEYLLPITGMCVKVRIIDAVSEYGLIRVWIEPISGTGKQKVNFDKLRRIGG